MVMERERGSKGADTAVSWLYFNHPSAKTGDFGGSWSKFYHLTARGSGPVNPTATRRDRWRHGLGPKCAAGGPKGPPVLRFAGKMRPQRDRTREVHAEEEHMDQGRPQRDRTISEPYSPRAAKNCSGVASLRRTVLSAESKYSDGRARTLYSRSVRITKPGS